MRRVTFPEFPNGNLRRLMLALQELYRRAGRPTMRHIAQGTSITHDTVHRLLSKPRADAPRWQVLEAVVRRLAAAVPDIAIEEEATRFHALWMAADEEPFEDTDADITVQAGHWVVAIPAWRRLEELPTTSDVAGFLRDPDDRADRQRSTRSLAARLLTRELQDLYAEAGLPRAEELAQNISFPQKQVRRLLVSGFDYVPKWSELEGVVDKLAIMAKKDDIEYELHKFRSLWGDAWTFGLMRHIEPQAGAAAAPKHRLKLAGHIGSHELNVLQLAASGLDEVAIADRVNSQLPEIKTTLDQIARKLSIESRQELLDHLRTLEFE